MIGSVTPIASGSSGLQALRSSADEAPRAPAPAPARSAAVPQPRSAVVQISAQAGAQAEVQAGAPTDVPAPATQPDVRLTPATTQRQDSASSRAIDLRYFDPADADKNGQISEFEQQAYDYRHPPTLAQQQLEQQQQQQQLRAYAEVARAGQAAAQQ